MTGPESNQPLGFPTPEELEVMEKNFGNLPDWSKQVKMNTVDERPLFIKHSEVDFEGLEHKPIAYTFDFIQKLFCVQRYLLLSDIEHLTNGKIPVKDHMIVIFAGNDKEEDQILRVNFAYEADDEDLDDEDGGTFSTYAEIVTVFQDVEEHSGRACIELVIPIASIESIKGAVVSEEVVNNAE